jgi:hypothetical protein
MVQKKKNSIKKENKEKLTPKKKQNRQLTWAIILMGAIILIIVLAPIIRLYVFDNFEYESLKFKKTGKDVIYYTTNIPLVNDQKQIYLIPWNFKNDPRDLEDIELDIPENTILFVKNETVYVSFESEAPSCDESILAGVGILNFLDNMLEPEVIGAFDNEDFVEQVNRSYITCENAPEHTVITLRNGNETMIKKVKDNCYELSYKDCEINVISEKFMFIILENYMKYFSVD